MSNQVKTFAQLKDSRLLYDKKIPSYGYYIIIAVLLLIIAVTIWSTKTPKIYVVKSSGTVQSVNKNYVMSPYNGKITDINIEEGMHVEKGKVLFNIKSTELDLQAKQLEGKKEVYLSQISQLKKLVESIKDNTNYFNEDAESDRLYYFDFKKYQSQIAQQKPDIAMFKAYGYSDEQIEGEIEKNHNKVSEIYYSTLKGVEDSISQIQNELLSLEIQLNVLGYGQEDYVVSASETGKIHMLADYKEGMVVQAGAAIANIAAVNDEYKIQANISADSRARISTGDKVDIAVLGLAQTVYGTISGKVLRIDSDITIDSQNNSSYFKIDIIPDNNYIISKNGYKVNLSNGMAIEARIQYDEVTYFDYVLEALGILIR